MNRPNPSRWSIHLIRGVGILAMLLGLLDVVSPHRQGNGWALLPGAFQPMPFNAALCFVLTGAGLFLCVSRRPMLAACFSLPAVVLGGLTLLEYILGINLHIDRWPRIDLTLPGGRPFPGRMAPNTAICFMLSGLAILTAATPLLRRQRELQIRLWGLVILILSSAALLSYLDVMILAYGGGHLSRMTAGSAAGFLALGGGLLLLSRSRAEISASRPSSSLPLLCGLAVLLAGVFMWQALIVLEKAHVEQTVRTQADLIQHEVITELKYRAFALQRMARHWERQEETTESEFLAEAVQTVDHLAGCRAIAWINPSFQTPWTTSVKSEPGEREPDPIDTAAIRRRLEYSRDRGQPILLADRHEPELQLAVPLFPRGTFNGFIQGVFDVPRLMQSSISLPYLAGYSLVLMVGDETLYSTRSPPPAYEQEWAEEANLALYSLPLRLKVIPMPQTLAELLSPLPEVGLFFGVVVASLFASTVQLTQQARGRALEAEAATRERETEINRRQVAEQNLRRAHEDLERRVQERTRDLARSNAELEQFAYVASHDLQEPLRMVTGYVELLERRCQDRLDTDAREFISFAVDGAHRMHKLIEDLLTFSRVGRTGKPFGPADLDVALDHALDNLAVTVQESGAEVTHDPLPTVAGDAVQLEQLWQNLVANSIKFRSRESPRIHIHADRQDGEWKISVRDNGIGIDPRHFERIFAIFQRLHTRREYGGTGIGLAVCKRVVERHGGRIWVESAPGQGSVFMFTLPAQPGVPWEPLKTEHLISC